MSPRLYVFVFGGEWCRLSRTLSCSEGNGVSSAVPYAFVLGGEMVSPRPYALLFGGEWFVLGRGFSYSVGMCVSSAECFRVLCDDGFSWALGCVSVSR